MSILNTVDLELVKNKLYEKLKPSGWGDKLKTFIMSNDFDKILRHLLAEARDGKRFTPPLKYIFRAFEECPYDKLKVVVLGQDPYPGAEIADGIAFSCSLKGKPEASLRYMLKEVEDTVYPLEGYTWNPDLKHWSNQGVLLLNTAFTTTMGKVGQHYILWQPFLSFLLDILTFQNPGLVYVFLGKKSQEWAESIPDNNWKLFASHPASAAYQDLESWDSGGVFNKVNKILKDNYNQEIIW
jgi:uracil-DNA glycosylase